MKLPIFRGRLLPIWKSPPSMDPALYHAAAPPFVHVSFPTAPIAAVAVAPSADGPRSAQELEVVGMIAGLARRLAEKSLKVAREGSAHVDEGRLDEARVCSAAAFAFSEAAEQVLVIARNL